MNTIGRSAVVALAVALAWTARAGEDDPILATTDLTTIRHSDVEHWRPVIEPRRRELRRLADDPGAAERLLLEEIALVDIALAEGGALVGATDRANLWWTTLEQQIRAVYLNQVLVPMVTVTDHDVRKIFDDHRADFQKPEGVVVLEIFRWAPVDLPDLRREAGRQLDELRSEITSPDEFKSAARDHSDATSALEGGSIGAIYRDRIDDRLERVLFGGGLGLTDVVATEHGLYLFWIARRLPAIHNSFADVRERIERRLRRERLGQLAEVDRERLVEEYNVVLYPRDGIALSVAGQPFGRQELGLEPAGDGGGDPQPNRERALTIVHGKELERLGLCPAEDPILEFRLAVADTAFNRLVDRAWRADETPPTVESAPDAGPAPQIERWSFDVLVVEDHPEVFLELFRIRHELGGRADLVGVRDRLLTSTGIEARIESYTDVLSPEVAPLGPEIHRTLKSRLAPGELSRPLAIDDRLVMLALRDRRVDEEASRSAGSRGEHRRALATLAAEIRARLLERHHFTVADAAVGPTRKPD